jgi:hypothetical protein
VKWKRKPRARNIAREKEEEEGGLEVMVLGDLFGESIEL